MTRLALPLERPPWRLGVALALLSAASAWAWQPPPPDLDRVIASVEPVRAPLPCRPGTASRQAIEALALQRCLAAASERHVCLHQWLNACG